ncbi:signal peptide-containing protein [Theileria equi strain WA]|uniref:Signal peptide-containing protein n=1 Tax=Theileria equi strain WA TaxID=1537102 RepID=L0AZW4_THEEQ|nr:signal peptide-containing protein [Theileria equi strain WA]AFZ81110.1 signal peptide-containing protein [Theileria equi strain WA]|eukprot:XP_004830776.1 signal peptide-containing protein [Theileria equi strain WA]
MFIRNFSLLLVFTWCTLLTTSNLSTYAYVLENFELENKITSHILKFGNKDSESTKLGSTVHIKIKSFSPILNSDLVGESTQTFEIGKHSVTPLNNALVNMRVGETRRIGIPLANIGKIYYEISLLDILIH